MPTLIFVIALIHALGAGIGAAGITFAEVRYLKAVADGNIDTHERDYIRTTFWALRWGMAIVLLSSIALGIVQYQLPGAPQAVLAVSFWASTTIALVIILAGYALAKGIMPWSIASALGFAGWWMILLIDAWRGLASGYVALLFIYILFVFASMLVWGYARIFVKKQA